MQGEPKHLKHYTGLLRALFKIRLIYPINVQEIELLAN